MAKVDLKNDFKDGDKLLADELNITFEMIEVAINDIEDDVNDSEIAINGLEPRVATLEANKIEKTDIKKTSGINIVYGATPSNTVTIGVDYNVTATKYEVTNKVDKIAGKGLSTNDYNSLDKGKVNKLIDTGDGTKFQNDKLEYVKIFAGEVPIDVQVQLDSKLEKEDIVEGAGVNVSYGIDPDNKVTIGVDDTVVVTHAFLNAWYTNKLMDANPVGSIYISVNNVEPAIIYGFGVWERYAKGRTLVGVDESQTEFNFAHHVGGSKTHLLSLAEMPLHKHTFDFHFFNSQNDALGINGQVFKNTPTPVENNVMETHSMGSGAAHNNLQPYIAVYMWRRLS